MSSRDPDSFRVLIAGGGVAGLEAALALRDLARDRVTTMMLAPGADFVYRPMTVGEPFGYGQARHYSLAEIAQDIGVEFRQDAFREVDPPNRIVLTESGEQLEYDAVLLAMGAKARPRFLHATTLDDRRLDEQLRDLIQDVEGGYVHTLAFLVPSPVTWPLPIYELALMTADRADDMAADLSITLVTPEDAPLAIFGTNVSDAVRGLLDESGIVTITSAYCETPEPGRVSVHQEIRDFDRILALPELFGPFTPGVPKWTLGSFISVDDHGQVQSIEAIPSLDRVFAAGDATDFVVKHGGIAAQQADAAAESIAALAGAPVEPTPFRPVVEGKLLTGRKPLYLRAKVAGWEGWNSEISVKPTGWPSAKIAAKYLAAYLDARDRVIEGAG
jgi:sulfide:quinone oxidoreductase